MEQPMSKPDALDNFLSFLFEGLEGYVYMGASDPTKVNDPDNWERAFFQWPSEVDKIKRVINAASKSNEVYIAPALFKSKRGTKEEFKYSQVVWADFDGNAPEWDVFGEHPSMVVQSSLEGRQHVYWKVTEPIADPEVQEDLNRRVASTHSADMSGWNCNKVLRPPETRNHKRGKSVDVVHYSGTSYSPTVFDSLAPAPNVPEYQFNLGILPDLEDVLLKYAIPIDLQGILKEDVGEGKRSTKLMTAAYSACQIGMSDVEVFVILKTLATKWGKFKDRPDGDKQLGKIVTRARQKYPDVLPSPVHGNGTEGTEVSTPGEEGDDDALNGPVLALDYLTFIGLEVEFDWVVEGMLAEQGNMLMAGPGGIGKSQIMLQFAKHVAMGKDYLHYNIPKPRKVAFWSLEMGIVELQVFMHLQDKTLTDEERQLLKENFTVLPVGESIPLNTPAGQSLMFQYQQHYGWEGLFVDSIGSSIIGNINSSEVVQPFTNFNDKLRNRHGCFLWYIHHTRKQGPGHSGHISQDDVYGDQYLVNRATSASGLVPAKDGLLRMRNFKNRLAKREDDYLLDRTKNLDFIKVDSDKAVGSFNVKQEDDKPAKANKTENVETANGLDI